MFEEHLILLYFYLCKNAEVLLGMDSSNIVVLLVLIKLLNCLNSATAIGYVVINWP